MNEVRLEKLWNQCIYGGEYYINFASKHNITILAYDWLKLMKMENTFRNYSEDEILRIHERAKYLVEYLEVSICYRCGKHTYLLPSEDKSKYAKEFWVNRNLIHKIGFGYGSELDMDEYEICDGCMVSWIKQSR